jgi:Zn-dependent M28 family amino/carboxypeptidase
MQKLVVPFLLLFSTSLYAQDAMSVINKQETERIEKYLSSDDLEGRRTYSVGIDKAAKFIAEEFQKSGLKTFNNASTYLQTFTRLSAKFISAKGSIDGVAVDSKNIIGVTAQANLHVDASSGYEIITIEKGASLMSSIQKINASNKNSLVLVDESFKDSFGRLMGLKNNIKEGQKNIIFILGATKPSSFEFDIQHQITTNTLSNVVAVLPGKSLANEFVVFSGHYDHLGIQSNKAVASDSIYNGANDDAAGTTAMLMLSKYFATKHDNERTLVFVAFTAEEIGGFGSQYFSKQLDPITVKAMFNLEMIGTESKWGKNSAYITGFEKSNMGTILQKNLEGSGFTFYPDPYTDQQLFYRSDNATLARLGVPAHTISTSKMDNEPNYHKPSDEFSTLDISNMNEIIKAIAISSQSIISGKDTPSRVDATQLR